jgi:hypothetical protein
MAASDGDAAGPRPGRSPVARARGFVAHLRELDRERGRLVPRWLVRLFAACALWLIPWSVFLVLSLPEHTTAHAWNLAWAGFDVGLAVALAAMVLAILRRSAWSGPLAAICGTLLVVDAWFDVVTSSGDARLLAIAMAVLLELPLAFLCFATARHISLVVGQARRYLDAAGVHLVRGRLVGPEDEPDGPRR